MKLTLRTGEYVPLKLWKLLDSSAVDPKRNLLHVVDLYVDRAARNQGVGKALMARAASIAREASAEEMIWSVYQPNTIAATFYEKLGAQRITDVFFMKLSADKI